MKTKEELQKELKDLEVALKNGLLSTNEYCDRYYAVSQKIKKLN